MSTQGTNSGAISSVRSRVVSSGAIESSHVRNKNMVKSWWNPMWNPIAMFEYRSQVPPSSSVWSALVHSCATSSIECANMCYGYGFYEIFKWRRCSNFVQTLKVGFPEWFSDVFSHFLRGLKLYSWENLRTKWGMFQQAMVDYGGIV